MKTFFMENLKGKTQIKLAKKNDLTVVKAFEKYQQNSKLKNLAEQSIKAQADKFKKFHRFLNFDELILIKDIDKQVVDDYTESLLNEDIKISSVNIYLKYLRIFINFCSNNGYCNTIQIKLLKDDTELKQGYNESQLAKLLEKPNIKKTTFANYRNYCMICFLIGTGVRRNTIVNIRIGDLDFENNLIALRITKSRKQQLIPMSLNLKEVLIEYLSFRGGNAEDYLFVSSYGNQLSPEGANKALREYNRKHNIDMTGMHNFRRSFATMAIQNNCNLFILMQLMGHSSIKTTQKYVNLTIDDLQENYSNINALDTILSKNKKTKISMRGK